MDKWQTVILEWVNCLKIADPIKDISFLSKNNFFKTILQKLCKDDGIKYLDQSMVQDRLYQFIRDSYPDYEIAQDGAVTTEINLIYICSLLMYYCAIHSEDKSLREPACRSLSLTSQQLYTSFLQSILDNNEPIIITRELLSNAIKESCKLTHILSPQRPRSTESIRSNNIGKKSLLSPHVPCFTDFIHSPEAKKQKHLEYVAREMRILKADLETERDEKIDLHDEIKRQKEEISQLTKDLERKKAAITLLNNQILEQEKEVTPPKTDSNIVIKLRTNLKDAEKRIEDLENQLIENEKQNKSLSYKLTTVKSECQLYEQRCEEYESENRTLTELTTQRATQITALTTQIDELKTILEEYQTNNTSILSNSYMMSEPENMGAVIELQLKEIENENTILKQKYDQLQVENSDLQQQIVANKLEMAKYRQEILEKASENTHIIDETKCMQKSLDKLNAEFKILQNKHVELEENYEKKKIECEKLAIELSTMTGEYESRIEKLEEGLIEKNVIIEHKEGLLTKARDEIATFKADIQLRMNDIETQQKHITALTKQINDHETALSNEKQRYDELFNEKENLALDFTEKCDKYQQLECNLNESKQMLETTYVELKTKESEIEHYMNTTNEYEQKILHLKSELNSVIEMKDTEISQKMREIEALATSIKTLQSEHQAIKTTYLRESVKVDNLTKMLIEFKSTIEELEHAVKAKEQQCSNFERKNVNNLALIEVLNKEVMKLQPNIDEKESEIVALKKHLEEVKKQMKHDKMLIRDNEKKLSEYNAILDSKAAFVNKLESQLSHVNKNLKESECKVSEKNKTINNLEIIISNYDSEITELKKTLDDNDRHITDLNVHEEELIRKYEKDIEVCNKEFSTLKQQIEAEKQTLMVQLEQSESNLDKLRMENEKILNEKNFLTTEIGDVKSENDDLKSNLFESTTKFNELDKNFTIIMNEKISLTEELRTQKKNLDNLQDKYEMLNTDCNQVKDLNQKMLKDNKNLSKHISELEKSNAELKTELSTIKQENEQLKIDLKKLNCDLENLEKQYKIIDAEYADVKKLLEAATVAKDSLLSDVEKLGELESKYERVSVDLSNQLEINQQLQFENQAKASELSESKKLYEDLMIENEKMSTEMNIHTKKYQDLENEKKNVINTNIALNDRVREVQSHFDQLKLEYNNQRIHYEDLSNRFNVIESDYNKLAMENENLIEKLDNSKLEFDNFKMEKNDLFVNISQLENSNARIKQEILEMSKELELQKDSYEKLVIDNNTLLEEKELFSKTITSLENRIAVYNSELQDIHEKYEQLNSELQHFKIESNDLRSELTEEKSSNIEKITEVTVELSEKIDKLTKLETKYNRLLDDNTVLNKQLMDTRNKLDDLTVKQNRLTIDFESREKESAIRISDLDRNYLNISNELTMMVEKYSRLEIDYNKIVVEKENFLRKIVDLENQVSDLKSDLCKCRENLNDLSKEHSALETKYRAYGAESETELKMTKDNLTQIQGKLLSEIESNEKLVREKTEEKTRLYEQVSQLECENTEMKMKLSQITKINKELSNKNTDLTEQIETLDAQNSTLRKELIELQQKFEAENHLLAKNYETQFETIKAEYEESRNFTKKVICEKDILIEKMSDFENRNMDLNSELLQTKKELLMVNETYGDLENRYKAFMNENESKIRYLEEQIQINKLKSEEFTKQYEQSQKDLEMLKESANVEKQYYEKLVSQKEQIVNGLTEDIRRLTEKINQLESDKRNLGDKCTDIEKKYTALVSTYSNLEQSKKMIENEHELLKNENVQIQDKLQRMEADKIEIEKQNEKSISKKDRFISDLEMITTNLKEEITKLAEKNVMLIKEIDILRSTLTTVQNENKTLTENLDNVQCKSRKSLGDKEKEVSDIQKECKVLEKKLLDMENEKMKIITEKNRIQDEVSSIKASRDQLLTKHSDMSNQIEEYIHRNFELRKQIEKLEQQLVYEKDSRSEIQQMLRKQTDISEKSQEYVKQNVELSKKIEQLEKLLRIESENATKNEKAIKDQIKTAASDVRELQSQIDQLNEENAVLKTEKENLKIENLGPRPELIKLREAYEQVVSENSQLKYELNSIKKLVAEKDLQLSDSGKLKEAYEKLFKEHDSLKNELDAAKEKRVRDKEDFLARLEQSSKFNEDKMRELRINYDEKLEKMKSRMKQLYAEEVAKTEKKKEVENQLLCKAYEDKIQKYEECIKDLQSQMWVVGDKFLGEQQDKERMHKQLNDAMKRNSQLPRHEEMLSYPSHESLQNVGRESLLFREKTTTPLDALFKSSSKDSMTTKQLEKRDSYLSIGGDKQKKPVSFIVPLPAKNGREKKANRVGPITQDFKEPNVDQPMRKRIPRNSVNEIGQGLHMEDEEVEMFNTNYLSDLQAGRCVVTHPAARPSSPKDGTSSSDKSRLTELQVRNSLCPPHLKSSYPAETQFHSPTKFKEDDLKTGNIHLDDSLNTCLLPDEKPRRKESTFYKKPGPSTPSKRSSFQGTESREILREQNTEQPVNNTLNNRKSSTPNRIMKALFPNRSSSLRADTENQPVTPRNRRYNIFRKQR